MKAVILNSGMGRRMGAYTADRPKCLVEIDEQDTILSRQIRQLLRQGLGEVLITTGPHAEKIKGHLAQLYPELKAKYVNNPRYETTNYIYSLLLARKYLNEEILLLHGDLVFEEGVLQKVLASPHENAVLVNRKAALPEKDFKGRVEGGRVRKIAVDIFDEHCSFLVPLYRLSQRGIGRWLEEMERFEKAGRLDLYAEDALNNLLDELALYPVYYENELCMEIDTPEDLAQARRALRSLSPPGQSSLSPGGKGTGS